jgi:hypothetical protein
MSKYNNAINSSSYEYLKSLIHPRVRIVNVEVRGKWLTVYLSSGVKFSVINNVW